MAVRCIFTASYGSLGSVTRRPPAVDLSRLDEATKDLDPPFAAVDLDALNANADGMVARSSRHPIRLASKSIRCRSLLTASRAAPRIRRRDGVLAAPRPSGSPSKVRRTSWSPIRASTAQAWHRLSGDPLLAATISVIVDSIEHLDVIDDCEGRHRRRAAPLPRHRLLAAGRTCSPRSAAFTAAYTRRCPAPWRRPSATAEGCGWSD